MVKRFVGNCLLLVAAFAMAFAVGEVVVRALFKEQTTLFPRYHTDYRYGPYTLRGIRPNADFRHTSIDGSWRFITNSRGLRDRRDFAYDKAAGTLRVLSLGDSHTQGYEVRQAATFSAVLERHLESRGISSEVLNAGVSGFSTAEQLAYLENEGYKYRPDVVVLGFYANDYVDNLKAGLFEIEDGRLIERRFTHVPGVRIQNLIYSVPTVKWLSEHSYFYSVLFNTVWTHFKARLRANATRDVSGSEPGSFADDFEYAVVTSSDHSEYEVALAAALLERMRLFCEERGIRFIVVDVPRRESAYRSAPSLTPALEQALRASGVEIVDSGTLLDALQGAAEMHVANGHQHISELTHTLIGVDVGRRIIAEARGPLLSGDLAGMELSSAEDLEEEPAGRVLAGAEFSGVHLSNTELAGVELAGFEAAGVELAGAKLADADVEGVVAGAERDAENEPTAAGSPATGQVSLESSR